jgi:hypothetical protein
MVLRGSFAKRIAMKKVMKVHEKSHARLDAFSRGMIWGMHLANVPVDHVQTFRSKWQRRTAAGLRLARLTRSSSTNRPSRNGWAKRAALAGGQVAQHGPLCDGAHSGGPSLRSKSQHMLFLLASCAGVVNRADTPSKGSLLQ